MLTFLPALKHTVVFNALQMLKKIAKDGGDKFVFSYLRNSPNSQNCWVVSSLCRGQGRLLHVGDFWKPGQHWTEDLSVNAEEHW